MAKNLDQRSDTRLISHSVVFEYFDAYLVMNGMDKAEGHPDGSRDEDERAVNVNTNTSQPQVLHEGQFFQ